MTEDEVEGYLTYARGFAVTNVLNGAKQSTTLSGMVFWTDDDNAGKTRPKSVTINLLKDGNKIDSQEVTADKSGIWAIEFVVPGTYWDAVYTVTEEAVEGYTTKVYPPDETGGMLLVSNTLEGHEHVHKTVSSELVAPTCTAKGLRRTVEYCEGCGEIFSDVKEDIPALGHDWGDWQRVRVATETQEGLETRTCTRDKSHTQSRAIPMTGHVHGLTHVEAKAATCTEDGNTEYWECTEGENPCGMRFADEAATEWVHEEATVIHATGHEWGPWTVVRAPSETVVGVERRACEHDPLHVEFRIVPKLNHVHGLTHVEAKAATCTEDGNIEYWKCTEGEDPCGLCFADEGGTDWVHEEATVVHATGHDWGEWRIVKAATESEQGEMLRICHNDFTHMQTRLIPKVGHVHRLVRVAAKPATCTEDGNIEYWKCADEECGMLFKDSAGGEWVHEEAVVVHALGHEWGEPTYEWAPDNSSVTAQRVCGRCGEVDSQTVPTTSVVTREPQFGVPGQTTYTAVFSGLAFYPQVRVVDDIPARSGIAYVGNGSTAGSMAIAYGESGAIVSLAPCAYSRGGYDFVGWNTKADGSGTMYMPGSPFRLSAGGDWLFAQWSKSVGRQPMYRLYNPNSGEHFYTASVHERDATAAAGWSYEGIGWVAPTAGSPVYRLYNAYAGDHHYTISAGERDALVGAGWSYEGIGWRSAGLAGKPIWREYNPNAVAGAHNFTSDRGEHLALINLGWRGEGIAWYGL